MSGNDEHCDLAREVIGLAMKVHRHFGPGFVEVVYQNALIVELRRTGHAVECQYALKVKYEETIVGEFIADLLIDGRLLVELKAVRVFDPAHESQLMNYLHATGLNQGLLLNFGASSLQFRTKSRLYQRPRDHTQPDFSLFPKKVS
jgi:GxxExxY protein